MEADQPGTGLAGCVVIPARTFDARPGIAENFRENRRSGVPGNFALPDAGIDVDKVEDLQLVESILIRSDSTRPLM